MENTIMKYDMGGQTSGTDIVIHLRLFVLIDYICDFRKDRKIIEYNKYQWTDQNHQDILKWAINTQNIFCYDNEL